ncbi:MAG: thiamine pyrophosphate-dependent enzyme [Candidatus Saelkia tenebricola]|nr:thiamine pyrophosphate-dependent enzyme [Candidatus Saelkia tenebricola]
MKSIYKKPISLNGVHTHYCTGCGHGLVHRLIAEVIDELKIRERTIGIAPVGCAVLAYDYWNFDVTEAAHGRPLAVATGIKRVQPDKIVFTYQGDGDLASIGANETIHAANRGENLTVIFINNGVYGMTGGQMAPTTLMGQKTTTTKLGRDHKLHGFPLPLLDMLKVLDGVCYLERRSLFSPAEVIKAKKAISKSFINQIDGLGFSMVEILSPCPTHWKMSSLECLTWIEKEVTKTYPVERVK